MINPTYKEQLDWLDMVQVTFPEASEMIKAIKENVIAVRNYEKAIENELRESKVVSSYAYPSAMLKSFSDRGWIPRADELNPREESLIDNRIKKLQAELQFELSRKKQFRNQQAIDHCHKSINNLRKWKSQSL